MTYWNDGASLYHHGILGMKWGVSNGPPYPLKPEAHNAAERKAGWQKSLNKDTKPKLGAIGRAIAEYKSGDFKNGAYTSKATENAAKNTGKDGKEHRKNAELDKRINEQYKNSSLGATIVKRLILGQTGEMTYNMARSIGESKAKAFIRSVADIKLSTITGLAVDSATEAIADKLWGTDSDILSIVKKVITSGSISSLSSTDILNLGKRMALKMAGSIINEDFIDTWAKRSGMEPSVQQRMLRQKYTGKGRR